VACSFYVGTWYVLSGPWIGNTSWMLFLEATQNKKGPPHVCQGTDFDLYGAVVVVGICML
jgi:hypothetical protein